MKIPYLVEKIKNGKVYRYWQPKKSFRIDGVKIKCPFDPVSLVKLSESDALDEAKKLNIRLKEWQANPYGGKAYSDDTVGWLAGQYRKDERFIKLADTTKKLYIYTLNDLLNDMGDMPYLAVTRKHARAFYKSFSHTKRKASQVMQVARVVFSFAKDEELITDNPFAEQRVEKAKPRQGVVTQEQVDAAKEAARSLGLPSIAKAIQAGYDAGQRPADIRTSRRESYDGKWWRITQKKTGAVVDIPVYKMPKLKKEMDSLDHASPFFLHEERTNKPYSKDMLCRRVREAFEKAGIGSNVQFRDLRRACVVRMAEAGGTIPEICAITGHSLEEAATILKVYLPLSRKMAENGADKVRKLEKR